MKKSASLKSQNVKWLAAAAVADAVILGAVAYPATLAESVTALAGIRLAGAAILPLIAMLLSALVPAPVKDILVFWRLTSVLPGHRAFSRYAPSDSRIDLDRLRAKVGEFPIDPHRQNSRWYELYLEVQDAPQVRHAQGQYLLFRELAPLSLILAAAAPATMALIDAGAQAAWVGFGLGAAQYALTALASRFEGVRFVCNVLALHAGAAPKPTKVAKKKAKG